MTDVLAALDPDGVDLAVSRLLRAAGGADEFAARIAAAAETVPGWRGTAAEAAAQSADDTAGRARQVADLGSRAAVAIATYGEAARRAAAMRRQLDRAEERIGEERWALAAAGLPTEEATARAAAVARQRDAARDELTEAAHRCARSLRGLRLEVVDRPRDGLDHVGEGIAAFWAATVGGVVAAGREHGRAIVDDPVAGIVGLWRASAEATVQVLRDPTETAKDAVAWDEWAAGHWGTAAGTVAGAAVGKGVGKAGVPGGASKAPWVPGYPDGPLPQLQTVDEALEGVDLSRHEHVTLGHVLTRHVDVDGPYLVDRATSGTLLPDGTRGSVPPAVSAWTDRDVAEGEITRILRDHELEVRAFALGSDARLTIEDWNVPKEAGVVLMPESDDVRGYRPYPAAGATVRLRKDPEGNVYILTAHPEVR